MEIANCLNCGTHKGPAYIYCQHLMDAIQLGGFDETGETRACSHYTHATQPTVQADEELRCGCHMDPGAYCDFYEKGRCKCRTA